MVFVPVFLVAIIMSSGLPKDIGLSEDISTKVFRMHILANSDSDEDQELKLRVRDRVLKISEEIYANCNNVDDAINATKENISYIKSEAHKVIAFYGYDYAVKSYVDKEYFNTRKYDNFTLPAGMYDCLKIEIGQGKGHNWWCVMFPTVCINGCIDEFNDSLTPEEIKMIESNKYVVRFKAVEIYERVKSAF